MFGLLIAATIGVIASWQVQGRRGKQREEWLVQELERVRSEMSRLRLGQLQAENGSTPDAMDTATTIEVSPSEVSPTADEAIAEEVIAEEVIAEEFVAEDVSAESIVAEETLDEDAVIEITTTEEIEDGSALANDTVTIVMDNLESIRGIGPTFAHRLNNAGILTFADLVALPPEQLRTIASGNKKSKLNVDKWIAQAQQDAQ